MHRAHPVQVFLWLQGEGQEGQGEQGEHFVHFPVVPSVALEVNKCVRAIGDGFTVNSRLMVFEKRRLLYP